MTSRILSSTSWKIRSVFSMRVPGRRADMELDLPAVDRREEIAADQREHHGAERQHQDDDIPAGTMKRCSSSPASELDIAMAHRFEAPLERRVEAANKPRGAASAGHAARP